MTRRAPRSRWPFPIALCTAALLGTAGAAAQPSPAPTMTAQSAPSPAPPSPPPPTGTPPAGTLPPTGTPPTGALPPAGTSPPAGAFQQTGPLQPAGTPPTGTLPPAGTPPPTGTLQQAGPLPPAGAFPQPLPPSPVPPGQPLPDGAGVGRPEAMIWHPGEVAPPGYRIRYTVSPTWVIGGASTLALSYTVTTLVAAGIANSGPIGAMFAPIGSIPVVGAFPLSVLSAMLGAGPGTVATLIALGATQSVGLTLLIRGLKNRKEAGLVPDCDHPKISLSPFVSPQAAGIAVGGSL